MVWLMFFGLSSVQGTFLMAQATEHYSDFISANYAHRGHRVTSQSTLPVELRGLKGPVKKLIQNAYDEAFTFVSYDDKRRDQSYAYLFNEDKTINQVWLYSDNDLPIFKEIYYDFKQEQLQYIMKFYKLGKLEYSITHQYNNRKIPTGRKTTAGIDLTTERHELRTSGDTVTVFGSRLFYEYINGRMTAKEEGRQSLYEVFTYHQNGNIHEWLMYYQDELIEAVEYNKEGKVIEHQIYKNKPLWSSKESTAKVKGYGQLTLYKYGDNGLLSSEERRYTDTTSSSLTVKYSYDDNDILTSRQLLKEGSVRATESYLYNEFGDRLIKRNDETELPKIEFTDHDEHGNWTTKIVRTKKGKRRYLRRIEYFK